MNDYKFYDNDCKYTIHNLLKCYWINLYAPNDVMPSKIKIFLEKNKFLLENVNKMNDSFNLNKIDFSFEKNNKIFEGCLFD